MRRQLQQERAPLILSPFVLAELDYLLLSRGGVNSELTFLDDVSRGGYELAIVERKDVVACRDIIRDYFDIPIGIADASLVVLAERYRTRRILTLDRRHFSALRTSRGEPFELLP